MHSACLFSYCMALEVVSDRSGLLGLLQFLFECLQLTALMEQGRPAEENSAYT